MLCVRLHFLLAKGVDAHKACRPAGPRGVRCSTGQISPEKLAADEVLTPWSQKRKICKQTVTLKLEMHQGMAGFQVPSACASKPFFPLQPKQWKHAAHVWLIQSSQRSSVNLGMLRRKLTFLHAAPGMQFHHACESAASQTPQSGSVQCNPQHFGQSSVALHVAILCLFALSVLQAHICTAGRMQVRSALEYKPSSCRVCFQQQSSRIGATRRMIT